jgi:hypothetical protein
MAEVRCLISRKNYRQKRHRLQRIAAQGKPLLCGLEILRDGLKTGELPKR